MIESKTLGAAAGTQYQGVNDKSENISLPSLSNGVIVGKFKRGRMDKAFTVNANNYRALLGHDPMNPSYLAVEDAFARGISELSVLRVGDSGKFNSGGFSCYIEPSPWSNPITFEMVNRPTGNGGIQVSFGSPSSNGNVLSIGDWIDLSQLTTIEQFFEAVNDTIRNDAPYKLGVMSQDSGAVLIRIEPAANGHLPTKGLTSVTYAAEKVGDFYTYDEQYIGTNAEAVIDLASAFTDSPILFVNCEYISDLPPLPPQT